jgi:DNA mismatch repair protein MutL
MTRDDLAIAVERHATSKLDDDDLLRIRTLGFRGEALPSIGAVAKLAITTRHAGEPHAWALHVDAGVKSDVAPAALSDGTRVEVSRSVLRNARAAEISQDRPHRSRSVREVVRRLAMARPDIAFTLAGEERAPVTWAAALPGAPGRLTRLADILGAEFRASAIEVRASATASSVEGFAAAPSLTRANALGQYLFVNGRPVRDKLILGAVRAAYSDYLPRDRHPIVALFVTLDPQRGRCQRASGQNGSALPQRRTRSRADRSRAERGPCARRQAHRREFRRRGDTCVSSGPRSRARRHGTAAVWDWRQSPSAPAPRRLCERGSRKPRKACSTSVRPRPMCAVTMRRSPISSTARSARRVRKFTTPISSRRLATACRRRSARRA